MCVCEWHPANRDCEVSVRMANEALRANKDMPSVAGYHEWLILKSHAQSSIARQHLHDSKM